MRKILFLIPLLLALTFAGCKKDSNPTETISEDQSVNKSGQPMPDFSKDEKYNGVLATINYEMTNPIPGMPAISTNIAFASLGDGVDAGAVAVNSNDIGKMNAGGKTYYMVPNMGNPTQTLNNISFDGSNHSWNVGGANGVSSFNGSVKSPSTFNMTSPSQSATINKSGGIQIKWNGGTSSRVHVQITSINNSGTTKYQSDLSDNGTYAFSSSDLSSLSGECLVYVVKYNYSSVSSNGKNYYLIAEVVKSVTVKIN